jgi:Tfp pilus assembly protein PilO
MSIAPASPQARLIALGLALLAGLAVWFLAIQPVADAFDEKREGLAKAQQLAVEFRRRTVPLAELQAQRAALQAQQAKETGTIEAPNTAIASANLQAQIRSLLAASGGSVRSLQPLPPIQEAHLQKIALRIDATVAIDRLLDFLHAAEAASPYLFVDALEIRASEQAARNGQTPPALSLRGDLFAFLKAEGVK